MNNLVPWPSRQHLRVAGRLSPLARRLLLPISIASLILVCVGTWMAMGEPALEHLPASHAAAGLILILLAVVVDGIAVCLFSWSMGDRIGRLTRQRDRLRRDLLRSTKLATVGELSADLAHEVNCTLAALSADQISICHELERLDLDDETQESLTKSIASTKLQTERCFAITSKMLRLGRTKNHVGYAANIVPILNGIEELLCQSARRRGIELRLSVKRPLPHVVLDATELEIVLVNLVNNAIEAIDGSGSIEILAWHAGDEVLLSVEDSGTGIAPERVFQPFFTTKSVGQANGLGLSVSYEIVKGLGGTIAVQSEMGVGTVVTIRLPIHQPHLQEGAVGHPPGLRVSKVHG